MSGDLVTRWGVVFAMEAEPALAGDARSVITTGDVLARAQRAYVDRCAVLRTFLDAEAAEIRVVSERPGPAGPAETSFAITPGAKGALVGVSVVEVRPTSFDMAARIRPLGDSGPDPAGDPDGESGPRPIDGRWTLVLERTATGERLPVPREVRDELIAIQLAARDVC